MASYTSISICTGVGMLDHGLNLATGGQVKPILYVEREAFCCANLVWQMAQNILPPAPIWSDVTTITDQECATYVDRILAGRQLDFFIGGIPCQNWSIAGKRAGHLDSRDLWPAAFKAIKRFKPGRVFIENVPGILLEPMGGERIKRDLDAIGYTVTAGLFTSAEVGANHKRQRIFILGVVNSGHAARSAEQTEDRQNQDDGAGERNQKVCELADSEWRGSQGRRERREEEGPKPNDVGNGSKIKKQRERLANGNAAGLEERESQPGYNEKERQAAQRDCVHGLPHYAPARNDYRAWAAVAKLDASRMPCIERELRGVVDGVASRIDRIRSIGNGVDSLAAAYAFISLWTCLQE